MTARPPRPLPFTARHLAMLVMLLVIAISGISQYFADPDFTDPAIALGPVALPTTPAKTTDNTRQVATENPTPSEIIPASTEPTRREKSPESAREDAPQAARIIVAKQVIRDQSGRILFQGDIDLTPTLERIDRRERHPHRNDGGIFRNLERRLPMQPPGYYKEYVHPTPETNGPGPQRVVLGQQGEIYYTPDHYQTFQRIP